MSNPILVWELRQGDEILGTLLSVGRGRPPWIDCRFESKLRRSEYFWLFHRYTLVKKALGYNAWVAGGLIPPDPSESVDRNKLEKERVELLQKINSLRFTLVPVSPDTHLGTLTDIYSHGRHMMVVADFGDAPMNYWW